MAFEVIQKSLVALAVGVGVLFLAASLVLAEEHCYTTYQNGKMQYICCNNGVCVPL